MNVAKVFCLLVVVTSTTADLINLQEKSTNIVRRINTSKPLVNSTGGLNVVESQEKLAQKEEGNSRTKIESVGLGELTNKIKCLDKSPVYRRRPDKTVSVSVDISIISISALDLEKMEIRVELYLQQSWTDERCRYKVMPRQEREITLNGHGLEDLHNLLNHLWMPDTFFVNAKETQGHETPQPQQNTKVAFTGMVTHSSRLTVTGACPMSLWMFPFDRQHCSIILQSYSFNADQVEYSWDLDDPINFEHTLDYQDRMMPEVLLVGYRLSNETVERKRGWSRSQLSFDFYMERPLGHYMFDLYLPAVCIVFMSWINFWLTRSAAPERVGLGMTIVLTLTTHMANANSNLPKTSYPKAIGVYLSVCFVFTFAGLVENIIASVEKKMENPNSQSRQRVEEKRRKRILKQDYIPDSTPGTPTDSRIDSRMDFNSLNIGSSGPFDTITSSPGLPPSKLSTVSNQFMTRREKILLWLWPRTADQKSRMYFPLAFLVFNILYWAVCLTLGESLPLDVIMLRNATFLQDYILK